MVDTLTPLAEQKAQGQINWPGFPYYETVFRYPVGRFEFKMFDVAYLAMTGEIQSPYGSFKVKQADGTEVTLCAFGSSPDDYHDRVKKFCDERGLTGYPTA
jgi:hypothetical protein